MLELLNRVDGLRSLLNVSLNGGRNICRRLVPQPNYLGDPLRESLAVESQQDALDHIEVIRTTTSDDTVGSLIRTESQRNKRALSGGRRGRKIAGSDARAKGRRIVAEQTLQRRHKLQRVAILNREDLDQRINSGSLVELSNQLANQWHASRWCTNDDGIRIHVGRHDGSCKNARVEHLISFRIDRHDGQRSGWRRDIVVSAAFPFAVDCFLQHGRQLVCDGVAQREDLDLVLSGDFLHIQIVHQAGHLNHVAWCGTYDQGVCPIVGQDSHAKTEAGTLVIAGARIVREEITNGLLGIDCRSVLQSEDTQAARLRNRLVDLLDQLFQPVDSLRSANQQQRIGHVQRCDADFTLPRGEDVFVKLLQQRGDGVGIGVF